jgi:hypothetical protein
VSSDSFSGVARRRDIRRFGPGPFLTALRKDPEKWGTGFPYDAR